MPAKGLTDQKPAFPLLGRLRKGDKKTDSKKPGPDLTYFRFTSDRPEVAEVFKNAYGAEPKRITVYMPYSNALVETQDGEGCFDVWYEKWNASHTLLHRCDGTHVTRYFDTDKGDYVNPEPGTMKCPGGCEEVGRLYVIIPELLAAGYVGDVMLRTGSKHDILSILGSLRKTERERREHPDGLMGIAFMLERVDEIVSSPAWKNEAPGKRHRVEKSLVKLTPSANWVKAQLERQRQTAMLAAPKSALIEEAPEAVLVRNREIMHGPNGDIDTVTGEIIDNGLAEEPEPESDEVVAEPESANPGIPERYGDFVNYVLEYTNYTSPSNIASAIKECGVKGSLVGKDGVCAFNVADVYSVLAAAKPTSSFRLNEK